MYTLNAEQAVMVLVNAAIFEDLPVIVCGAKVSGATEDVESLLAMCYAGPFGPMMQLAVKAATVTRGEEAITIEFV